jgi:hypothetical protein
MKKTCLFCGKKSEPRIVVKVIQEKRGFAKQGYDRVVEMYEFKCGHKISILSYNLNSVLRGVI